MTGFDNEVFCAANCPADTGAAADSTVYGIPARDSRQFYQEV